MVDWKSPNSHAFEIKRLVLVEGFHLQSCGMKAKTQSELIFPFLQWRVFLMDPGVID